MALELEKEAQLKDYVWIYALPGTMEESIEQHRLDCIREADAKLNLAEEDYLLIGPVPGSPHGQLIRLYDPLLYFQDTSLGRMQPGVSALIPPVPADIVGRDESLKGIARPHVEQVAQKLSNVDKDRLVRLAEGVAASVFDSAFSRKSMTRKKAIEYIAYSTADNPVSEHLSQNPNTWSTYRREIRIPDMVEKRKAELIELFVRFGQPLNERELDCLSEKTLSDFAFDLRYYILEQNRHITFCRKCANKMLVLNQAINTPVTDLVM